MSIGLGVIGAPIFLTRLIVRHSSSITGGSYHFGRLGVSLGYVGLLLYCVNSDLLTTLKARLAAVGRMALTNYLMQSLICGLLYTGEGFALVGE